VSDVKKNINTVGRFTDDEIFDTIVEVDDFIYIEAGTPVQASWTEIDKIGETIQDTYYVGEENIYRVDRVFYGTTTKTEYYLDDGYKTNLKYGMIRFLPVASGGPTLSTEDDIEIHYIPRLYHKLSLYTTIVRLLEKIDFTSDGKPSKELIVARQRLKEVETMLSNKVSLAISSDYSNYDGIYGVNRKYVRQNLDRNRYLASTNW
jgi:hypothetical protein